MGKRIKKIIISLIPLIILGVAIFCMRPDIDENGMPTVKEDDFISGSNKDNSSGDEEKDYASDNNTTAKKGYKIEPKATYSPENKYYANGDEYGYTYEQEEYVNKWLNEEQKARKGKYDQEDEKVKPENVYSIGEEVPINDKNMTVTINSVAVYDNISDINKEHFFDNRYYEEQMVSDNGMINTVKRKKSYYNDVDDRRYEEDTTSFKLVVVDCTFKCNANWVQSFSMSEFELIPLVSDGEYYVNQYQEIAKENNVVLFTPLYDMQWLGNGEPCMFDKSIAKKRQSFFYTYITGGEVINCKLGYYVDEEYMDNMYVYYGGTTNYLCTESVLQKYIRLFE